MSQVRLGSRLSIVSQTTGVVIGAVVYLLALFPDGFRPGRTAVAMRYTSNFFDLQARALLEGRLNLPANSLGIEGFVVNGHTFMYFPPFPAVLRMPVLWATDEFDGRLTVVSMLLAWIVLTASALALWRAARQGIVGDAPMGVLEAVLTAASLAFITGGTTMTFNASLPWVYHEVYSWSIALAVGSAYWLMRVYREPRRRNIIIFGGFATAAIMTRTPTGLGMVCAGLLVVVMWWWQRRAADRPVRDLIVASLVPMVFSVGLNLMKFGHPFLFPLESQVWTGESAQRRAALIANHGSLTGLQFFETSFVNYLSPTGIRFTEYFPWITLPAEPAQAVGSAFLDQSYRTGSVTTFMFWGCLLLVVALIGLVVHRRDAGLHAFVAPLLGSISITAAVMTYGYIAHRYTSDFVPALVVGTAIGTPLMAHWLGRRRLAGSVVAVIAVAATVFSLAAQSATSQWMWAVTHRGTPLVEYVERQQKWGGTDGTRLSSIVSRSSTLPQTGTADELKIVGGCDGLYLATGDAYEPWVTVQARDQVALVVAGEEVVPHHTTDLFTVETTRTHVVSIQTDARGRARIIGQVEGETPLRGYWFDVRPGDRIRVAVRILPEYGIAQVESTPGGFAAFLPAVEWDKDWNARPGKISSIDNDNSLEEAGLAVRRTAGPSPELCRSLLADLRAR